jgi:hypothetical protein
MSKAKTLAGTVSTGGPLADGEIGVSEVTGLQTALDGKAPGTAASASVGSELKLFEGTDNGTNYVSFKAANSLAGNVTWTLPTADGTAGQALTTDGSGALAWGSASRWTLNGSDISYSAGNVIVGDANSLRLADADSSHYIGLKAPSTVAANVTYTLPGTDGTNGQLLTTNGSGTLSWATSGASAWLVSGSNIYYNTGNASVGTTIVDQARFHTAVSDTAEALRIGNSGYTTAGNGPYIGFDGGPFPGWNTARIQGIRTDANAAGALVLFTNSGGSGAGSIVERARIASDGKVGVNTSAPTALVHANGDIRCGTVTSFSKRGGSTLTFDVTVLPVAGGNDPGLIELTATQNDFSGANFGFIKGFYYVNYATPNSTPASTIVNGSTFTVSFSSLGGSSFRITITGSRQQVSASVTVLSAQNIT